MSGEHRLHAITNRNIRSRLADDPEEASAKGGRCFRRLHAHGLIAKIPRTTPWRVTDYGRKVMGTTMYLREHHFPNVYASVVHWISSPETRTPRQRTCARLASRASIESADLPDGNPRRAPIGLVQ